MISNPKFVKFYLGKSSKINFFSLFDERADTTKFRFLESIYKDLEWTHQKQNIINDQDSIWFFIQTLSEAFSRLLYAAMKASAYYSKISYTESKYLSRFKWYETWPKMWAIVTKTAAFLAVLPFLYIVELMRDPVNMPQKILQYLCLSNS